MTEFSIILGLLYLFVGVSLAAFQGVRKGRLTLLSWAFLGMGGIYGGGWALVAYVTMVGGNPLWEQWLLPFTGLYPVHTLGALILLSSMWLGWSLFGSLRLDHRRSKVLRDLTDGRLSRAMWALFIIAFFMQFIYTRAHGGFFELLKSSASIRAAIFLVDNPASFLQPFGGLALFASFGFFGLCLSGRGRRGNRIGFALSFFFSLYILFSWLSRIGFLVYLATFILGVLIFRKSRPLLLLLGGCLTMCITLLGAYYVSVWLNLKAADNLVVFLARELSFPFVSFFAQLDLGENLFRAFKDLLVAPIYLLPSSWWSSWGLEDVSQVNTAVIMGSPKGIQGETTGVPVDLLTLGLMQASIAGIAVIGAGFGALLRLMQGLLYMLDNPGAYAIFEACVVLKIAVLGIFYSQPALLVSENFAFLVTVIIIAFFLRVPRLRLTAKRRRHERDELGHDSAGTKGPMH